MEPEVKYYKNRKLKIHLYSWTQHTSECINHNILITLLEFPVQLPSRFSYLEIMSNGLKRRTQTGIMVEVKGRSNSDSWLVDSNKTYPILRTFDWLRSMTRTLISHSMTHEPLTDPNKFEMKKTWLSRRPSTIHIDQTCKNVINQISGLKKWLTSRSALVLLTIIITKRRLKLMNEIIVIPQNENKIILEYLEFIILNEKLSDSFDLNSDSRSLNKLWVPLFSQWLIPWT